jgi:hypothetical protein
MRGIRTALATALTVASLLPATALAGARITEPVAGATIHDNSGDVHVTVAGVPPGDSVLPVLDGKAAQVYYATPVFDLHGVPRGTHDLHVDVQSPRERIVGRTPTVRFQVWQATRLNPPKA